MLPKKRGRKPMKLSDKVVSKPVYLTKDEWDGIIKKYGSPTQAVRQAILKEPIK